MAGLLVVPGDPRRISPHAQASTTSRRLATCAVSSVFTSGWRGTQWTRGVPLGELLDDLPHVSAEFDARRLGGGAPSVPVLLWGSRHDDVVPVAQVRDLRDVWRTAGADVTWYEDRSLRVPGRTGANHFGPYYRHLTRNVGWLLDQLRR